MIMYLIKLAYSSLLEDRISVFENYIASIVKRIDEAEGSIRLSAKELELLKLYGALCANRQHFTSEVILHDESGIYRSNNYLFGTYRFNNQEDVVKITEHIIDDFEKIMGLDDNLTTQIDPQIIEPRFLYSTFTIGLHVVILRSK